MEIEVLRKKVEDNKAKIAKKVAYIEKNKARMEKLINKFESITGLSYDNEADYEKRRAFFDRNDEASHTAFESYYKIGDCRCHIRNSEKDIKKIQKVLDNWQSKLDIELNKESKRHYPVLEEFLDNWEKSSVDWLKERFDYVGEAYIKFQERRRKYAEENGINLENPKYTEYIRLSQMFSGFKTAHGLAGRLYFESRCNKEKYDKLVEEFIAKDKKVKYDDLIERAEFYVKEITDMSDLKISPKGELDGIITGTGGKVKFNTIGAGGYNIQRFHYRVLVKRIE